MRGKMRNGRGAAEEEKETKTKVEVAGFCQGLSEDEFLDRDR